MSIFQLMMFEFSRPKWIFLKKKNGRAFEQATQAVKGKAKKLAFSFESCQVTFRIISGPLLRRKKRTSPTLLTLLVSLEKRESKEKVQASPIGIASIKKFMAH